MFRVKICGVTNEKDLRLAARAGADAIGFQMSRGPRKLTPAKARVLVRRVPVTALPVGVFVDEPLAKLKRLIKLCGFQAVQLHGAESADYCRALEVPVIKVIRMKRADSYKPFRAYPVAAFLLDTYNKNIAGGTGRSFRTSWAREAVQALPAPVLLAGGLTSDNVPKAIRASRAFGVDVSSGVEVRPGLKDPRQVSRFIRRAKAVFRSRKGT
jgi:phosphoribosylanthranilate isomerase